MILGVFHITHLSLLAYVSTQVLIFSNSATMETPDSSLSRGRRRGTSEGQTARPRSNSSRAWYSGMWRAMSSTARESGQLNGLCLNCVHQKRIEFTYIVYMIMLVTSKSLVCLSYLNLSKWHVLMQQRLVSTFKANIKMYDQYTHNTLTSGRSIITMIINLCIHNTDMATCLQYHTKTKEHVTTYPSHSWGRMRWPGRGRTGWAGLGGRRAAGTSPAAPSHWMWRSQSPWGSHRPDWWSLPAPGRKSAHC